MCKLCKMCYDMFQHLDTCPGDVISRLLGACSIYGIHAILLEVRGIYFCSESRINYLPDHVRLLKKSCYKILKYVSGFVCEQSPCNGMQARASSPY
ncbi:hypothetical protein QL285_002847 [Trifolium repens]|nr:hypothetical protein QL285_002847 [Trifolium repens]